MIIKQLQKEAKDWGDHNFPNQPAYHPLLGIGEEVGELMHAHLKGEQGIRLDPLQVRAKKIDALGDIFIYMCNYASAEGIDLEDAIQEAWNNVKDRDWVKYPKTGKGKPFTVENVDTIVAIMEFENEYTSDVSDYTCNLGYASIAIQQKLSATYPSSNFSVDTDEENRLITIKAI